MKKVILGILMGLTVGTSVLASQQLHCTYKDQLGSMDFKSREGYFAAGIPTGEIVFSMRGTLNGERYHVEGKGKADTFNQEGQTQYYTGTTRSNEPQYTLFGNGSTETSYEFTLSSDATKLNIYNQTMDQELNLGCKIENY